MICCTLHLVDLSNYSIQNLALKWSEHNSFVFDWVHNKTSTWLYGACSYVINGCHCYHKPISLKKKKKKSHVIICCTIRVQQTNQRHCLLLQVQRLTQQEAHRPWWSLKYHCRKWYSLTVNPAYKHLLLSDSCKHQLIEIQLLTCQCKFPQLL